MKTDRFKKRRILLASRRLCVRCGHERPRAGHKVCDLCAAEKRAKKIAAPPAIVRAEKIARLERNRAFFIEALRAVDGKINALRCA